ISGLMSDTERQRAERDLEVDPAFRDAVMQLAERMHLFDGPSSPEDALDDSWKLVAARIAELPQMQPMAIEANSTTRPAGNERADRFALFSTKPARALMIGIGVILAFALCYFTTKS
ncbi:MAG TPA: hypothetical protein VGM46_02150, partial [Mesorhizobium sp.]